MSRVLVATDKFKGSCDAVQVGQAVATGLRRQCPNLRVDNCPVADGGDGTVAAAMAAGYTSVPIVASGPAGEAVRTSYARHGDLAVIELADVSGLVKLPRGRLAAMTATSRGTGEVIAAAIDAGCTQVVLGVGGSACTDGGAGMVQALGARLLDAAGAEIGPGGAGLAEVAQADLEPLTRRLAGVEIVLASDVDNALTGQQGAATVYGPQKGADAGQVRALDAALDGFADLIAATTGVDHRDTPGSGAAGGVGFAAASLLGARLRSGIEMVLELVSFSERLAGASLVITGEGSLDEQTLHGKAPAGVAAAARQSNVPVVAVCGRKLLDTESLREAGITGVYALSELEEELTLCIAHAPSMLERLGEHIASEYVAPRKERTLQ